MAGKMYLPGMEEYESKSGVDFNGKHYTWQDVHAQKTPETKALYEATTYNAPLYSKAGGGYTIKPEEMQQITNIDISKNGINITAPQSVLDSDTFKNTFGSSTFQTLAKNYLSKPNGEVTDANGEKHKVADVMESYRNALQTMADQRPYMDATEKNIQDNFGVDKLSDEQIRTAMTWASSSTDSKTAIPIPEWASEDYDFTQLESWNPETRTISKADFDKFYQLNLFDDAHVEKLQKRANQVISSLSKYANSKDEGYIEAAKEDDFKNEIVRTLSFYNSLFGTSDNPNKPKADAAVSVSLGIASFANAFTDGLFGAVDGIGKFFDWIGGDNAIQNIILSPIEAAGKTLEALAGTGKFFKTVLYSGGNAGIALTTTINELAEAYGWDDDTRRNIAEAVVKGVDNNSAEIGAIIDNKTSMSQWWKSYEAQQNALSDAWGAGMVLGRIAYKIYENVALLNVAGGAAGDFMARALGATTTSDVTYLLARELPNMTEAAVKELATYTTRLASDFAGINLAGKLVGGATNVFVQGIIETIADEPEAMAKLYANGDTAELADKLVMNTFYNGIGELSGWGMGKAKDWFKTTKAGEALTLAWGKGVNKLGELKTRAKIRADDLAARILGDDSLAANKRDFLKIIKNLEQEAASAKTLEDFEAAIRSRTILENAYDSWMRGGREGVEMMQITPGLGGKILAQQKAMAAVATAAKNAGFDIPTGFVIPQEVSNYISYRAHEDYLLNKKANAEPGSFTSKDASNLEYVQGRLAEYREMFGNSSEDLLSLADENYRALQEAHYALKNWQLKNGIIDQEEIDALRGTGFFGENGEQWLHTQRFYADKGETAETAMSRYESEVSQYGFQNKTFLGEVNKPYADFESGADFLDPNIVFEGLKFKAVQTFNAKQWGDALLNAQGGYEVIGIAKNIKHYKSMDSNFNEFQAKIKAKFSGKSFAKDFNTNLDAIVKESKLGIEAYGAQKKAISGEIEAARKSVWSAQGKFNRAANNAASMAIDADDISVLSGSFNVPSFVSSEYTAEQFSKLYDSLPSQTKAMVKKNIYAVCGDKAKITLENFEKTINTIDDFQLMLQRSYVSHTKAINSSAEYKNIINRIRTAEFDAQYNTTLLKEKENLASIMERSKALGTPLGFATGTEDTVKEVANLMDKLLGSAQSIISNTKEGDAFIAALKEAGLDAETAMQYSALNSLLQNRDITKKMIQDYIFGGSKELSEEAQALVREYAENISSAFDKMLESRYNTFTEKLISNGHKDMVDMKEYTSRVRKYAKELGANVDEPNIISVLNENGEVTFVKTDPLVADLYTKRPNFSDVDNSSVVKFFNRTNRLFRLGTTGFNPVSYARQWAKDSTNAFVMGGARPFVDGKMSGFFGNNVYAKITDSVVNTYGDSIAASLRKELGEDGWASLEAMAKERGISAKEMAVQYELKSRPMAIAGVTGTESKYLQQIAEVRQDSFLAQSGIPVKTKSGVKRIGEGFDKVTSALENVVPNEAREMYLRNLVYQTNYLKALDAGKSMAEARDIATRVMRDATTNFSRVFAFGNKFTRSVPYLGAALNGSDSFWRLLELDPAGVAGRFIGGMVIPYMSLLAESLADPQNREIYKNIREYDKQGDMVFVANGQIIKFPVPEELAGFLSIFRKAVEKSADANDRSWLDLIINDFLQLPAIDLTGFYDLDPNLVGPDPTFAERMLRGAEKTGSQMMPVVVKTAYMAAFGRDPYTGQNIDRSEVYLDDNMQPQIMDNTQSAFARTVSEFLSSIGINLSPSAANKIINSTIGNGWQGLLDGATELFSDNPDKENKFGAIGAGLANIGQDMMGVYTETPYNVAQADWKRMVTQLYDEKEALVNSDEYKKLARAAGNTALSEEKRKAAQSQYKTYIQDYQQKVIDTANKMKNKYGITAIQQASVLSLLIMGDTDTAAITENAQDASSELYYAARSQALQTMSKLGFTGSDDVSIFGYGKYDSNGNYTYKYNAAPDILDASSLIWDQSDITAARVGRAIKSSGLDKEMKEYKNKRSELYSQKNYNGVTQLEKEWNLKVFEEILPIIDEFGLDNVFTNENIINTLEPYIMVPSEVMGKGKYISGSTEIDKNKAYAQMYLRNAYNYIQEVRSGKRK